MLRTQSSASQSPNCLGNNIPIDTIKNAGLGKVGIFLCPFCIQFETVRIPLLNEVG